MKLFYWIGEKIYSILENTKKGSFFKKQPAYDFKKLYPGKNSEDKLKDYYIKKIGEVFCVLFVGILFSVITFFMGYMEQTIIDGTHEQSKKKGRRSRNKTIDADDAFAWNGNGFYYDSGIWYIWKLKREDTYMYKLKDLLKDESGMGTVEIILIIVGYSI